MSKDAERTIQLTISLGNESIQKKTPAESGGGSPFVDEARFLKVANLIAVDGERNTEAGLTPVRLIEFRDRTQRQKIIQMLGASFQQVVGQLIPYLYLLGAHPKTAVRGRAAETVGELMCEVDFIRYKDRILVPWALSNDHRMMISVGVALARVTRDPRYTENVKTLLKHWITTSNPALKWTGLAACVQLGSLWPDSTLEFVEIALNRGHVDLLILAILVFQRLCDAGNADLVLTQLSQWIGDRNANPSLRKAAALIFLEAVRLPLVVGDGHLIDSAVDVFLVGLSDRKLANSGVIRSAMLEKLKGWAEESFGDPEKQAAVETLIKRLHVRAETQRDKERIVFHLRRWYRKDDRFAQIVRGLVQS